MKTILLALSCPFFFNCGRSVSFTKEHIRHIIESRSHSGPTLSAETYRGCETVPATGTKPQFEGTEFTGQPCSVTIHPQEAVHSTAHRSQSVEVSFISGPVALTTLLERGSDTFVTLLNENEVLLIQHRNGRVISVTQTGYDNKGHLNYGLSGDGNFIKSCRLSESEPCVY